VAVATAVLLDDLAARTRRAGMIPWWLQLTLALVIGYVFVVCVLWPLWKDHDGDDY